MTHLLAELLRNHDLWSLVLVVLIAVIGSGIAIRILVWPVGGRRAVAGMPVLFALVVTAASWAAFKAALAGAYPQLSLSVPPAWAAPALATSLLSSLAAASIQQRGRRSARNAMLAGSLLACGSSCMLFTGMAGVVQPFALAYDLNAVLIVMMLGAALCSYALWEVSNPALRHRGLLGAGLVALALATLAVGSLAAILPLEGWINALAQPDNLTSSPIVIIIAAESVAGLGLSLFGSLVDNRVAARDQLEANRLRQLADSTFEGILIHRDGAILDGNESLATLLGVDLAELRDSPLSRFTTADIDACNGSERGGMPIEIEVKAADGRELPVEILSRSISYRGRPALVTALRDVRERRASEERIHFLAHHDMLTELPNRVMLTDSLETSLRLALRTGAPLAVLCLDLDGFKPVNDTLGHAAGDQLLRHVAARLRDTLRETDFVARVGGDEFVVVQTTGAQPEAATLLARRIIETLSTSFAIDDQIVSVGTSIGIAICPEDGDTSTALLKKSDIALYRAKDNGRGWFCMFEAGMDQCITECRKLEQDLRAALDTNQLTLDFQPLFDSKRDLVAFEALVRWKHPVLGPVSPVQFIPLAERCGLIIQLGEWVMRQACAAASGWNRNYRVAVNLSPTQVLRGNLVALVSTVLRDTGLDPARLELEITEGVMMDSTENALRALHDLRALGTRLVLDDFGTGYSSLSYLHRFPIDKLKVDKSFVQKLESDSNSRAIVNAIISMSKTLQLEVTAEGIETKEQFTMLCAQGCHELQGFFLGRPMPQEEVTQFIDEFQLNEQAANRGRMVA